MPLYGFEMFAKILKQNRKKEITIFWNVSHRFTEFTSS